MYFCLWRNVKNEIRLVVWFLFFVSRKLLGEECFDLWVGDRDCKGEFGKLLMINV